MTARNRLRFAERGGLWVLAQGPIMLLAMALPPWLGHVSEGPMRWIAIALMAAGLALGLASRFALGTSFTPFPRPVEGGSHVARGPYRFVRHPMYSAILLAFGGWSLLWQCVHGAIAVLALLVFFDLKARREEAWLAAAYPGYAAYRQRTRKFVPFLY